MSLTEKKIAIIGLGYVGLPLAVAFSLVVGNPAKQVGWVSMDISFYLMNKG